MEIHRWIATFATICCALGPPVSAQSTASRSPAAAGIPAATVGVPLATAFEAAWQRAVAAREVQGQRQRADAERAAATSLWAAPPAVSIHYRDDRLLSNEGVRETDVALSWPLYLPGQRAARGSAAEAGLAVADGAQAAARLRVAGEVREAAWILMAQQADLEQADALVASLATLVDDVERRVRAGDLAPADALAARAEFLGATAQQMEARQRVVDARARWEVLTGLAAPPVADEVTATTVATDVVLSHPQLWLATAAAEHARKRVELLRTSRSDPPELVLGYRNEVPGRSESSQNSLAIGVRVPFGTSDRNLPLQAAALADLDVADSIEQRLRERLGSEATAARTAVQTAEQHLAVERNRAALLRERARLIDKSFRVGESPLPDLLRALSAAAQAEAAAARQQAALGLARARFQQALGLLP